MGTRIDDDVRAALDSGSITWADAECIRVLRKDAKTLRRKAINGEATTARCNREADLVDESIKAKLGPAPVSLATDTQ